MQGTPSAQATHAAPPLPQAELSSVVTHWFPEQQPVGQAVESHVQEFFTHSCPVAQGAHATPPVPQAELSPAVTHWFPEQQPFGHDVASHTQTPFTHSAPRAVQSWQTAPPSPQSLLASSWWQLPVLSQQPLLAPTQCAAQLSH